MKIDKTNKNIWVRKGTANFGKPSISAIGVKERYYFEGVEKMLILHLITGVVMQHHGP